jgi:hypothetical protein
LFCGRNAFFRKFCNVTFLRWFWLICVSVEALRVLRLICNVIQLSKFILKLFNKIQINIQKINDLHWCFFDSLTKYWPYASCLAFRSWCLNSSTTPHSARFVLTLFKPSISSWYCSYSTLPRSGFKYSNSTLKVLVLEQFLHMLLIMDCCCYNLKRLVVS